MNYKKDYYNILGVDKKATPETLRASYRRLAKLHHPDKNPGDPSAEERFKAINEAYGILSNEITRHIYDSYRANCKKEDDPVKKQEPARKKRTKVFSVIREKRIYVRGIIEVRFQGDPDLSDTYTRQWEQRFTIIPTEVLVTIISSDVYNNDPPEEFQLGYSVADVFTTPLVMPVNCRIITNGQEEYYQLDLYDIRIKDPVLKDITRHEQYSFGTLEGKLYGYVLHRQEEEVTEEYTEYSGATGQVETKTAAGYVFVRQQFYSPDGGTYWSEWKRNATYTGKYCSNQPEKAPVLQEQSSRLAGCLWLFVLLILIVSVWPPILFFILPVLAFLFLGWLAPIFRKALPLLGTLLIVAILLLAIGSIFRKPDRAARTASTRKFDSVSSDRTVFRDRDKQMDTMISHHVRWKGLDSVIYEIQLSVPLSALRRSTLAHEQMDEQKYALQGIGSVYRHMLDTDDEYTKPIASAFDSLAEARSLDREREASMIVSCIQSIPYSVVVDRSCSANYTDGYISQYLAHCEGDCCKGYSKFGVQSPVEFIGDLKGDCDTRALLLYDVLGKIGYRVALMTSNYYKHALIAVHLDKALSDDAVAIHIDEGLYYLWETTSRGFGPGELPGVLSDLRHWNIALIQ